MACRPWIKPALASTPLHELADLAGETLHRIKELTVGLPGPAAEKLESAEEFSLITDRKRTRVDEPREPRGCVVDRSLRRHREPGSATR
jgi:hypothetical protein